MPRDCLAICVGKSTYARCGIIVNVTPIEPEWRGKITLEISNTTPLPAKIYANEGIAQLDLPQGRARLRRQLRRQERQVPGPAGTDASAGRLNVTSTQSRSRSGIAAMSCSTLSHFDVAVCDAASSAARAQAARATPPLSRRGEVVAQGTGPLSFRAPDRGLVSVYDVATNTIIHSSGVTPGSVLTVNTNSGNITVSDPGGGTQTVYQGLNKSHRYEIWFIPAHAAHGGTTRTAYSTAREQGSLVVGSHRRFIFTSTLSPSRDRGRAPPRAAAEGRIATREPRRIEQVAELRKDGELGRAADRRQAGAGRRHAGTNAARAPVRHRRADPHRRPDHEVAAACAPTVPGPHAGARRRPQRRDGRQREPDARPAAAPGTRTRIYLDPTTPNVMRQGIGLPGDVPR